MRELTNYRRKLCKKQTYSFQQLWYVNFVSVAKARCILFVFMARQRNNSDYSWWEAASPTPLSDHGTWGPRSPESEASARSSTSSVDFVA